MPTPLVSPLAFSGSPVHPGLRQAVQSFPRARRVTTALSREVQGDVSALWEALVMLIDPVKFSHVTWRHFASDESDALNDWLQLTPQAQPVCANVGKLMSVDDFFIRLTSCMTPHDVLASGEHCHRFHRSPRISHDRDLGMFVDPCFKDGTLN